MACGRRARARSPPQRRQVSSAVRDRRPHRGPHARPDRPPIRRDRPLGAPRRLRPPGRGVHRAREGRCRPDPVGRHGRHVRPQPHLRRRRDRGDPTARRRSPTRPTSWCTSPPGSSTPMVDAGCRLLIVHAEACVHLHRTLGAHQRPRRGRRRRPQPRHPRRSRGRRARPRRDGAGHDGQPRLRRPELHLDHGAQDRGACDASSPTAATTSTSRSTAASARRPSRGPRRRAPTSSSPAAPCSETRGARPRHQRAARPGPRRPGELSAAPGHDRRRRPAAWPIARSSWACVVGLVVGSGGLAGSLQPRARTLGRGAVRAARPAQGLDEALATVDATGLAEASTALERAADVAPLDIEPQVVVIADTTGGARGHRRHRRRGSTRRASRRRCGPARPRSPRSPPPATPWPRGARRTAVSTSGRATPSRPRHPRPRQPRRRPAPQGQPVEPETPPWITKGPTPMRRAPRQISSAQPVRRARRGPG